MTVDESFSFLSFFWCDALTFRGDGSKTTVCLGVLVRIDGLLSNRFILLLVHREKLRKIGNRGHERVIHEGLIVKEDRTLVNGSI